MRTINKIHVLGYVGRDSELNKTSSGLEVAGVSIATSTLKKDGEKVTQWHNCVAFGKTAELLATYAKKGARIYVEGEMQYSEYEKEGVRMLSAKILISAMSFIDFEVDAAKQQKPLPKKQETMDDDDFPF